MVIRGKKVVVSKDVVFDESKVFKDLDKEEDVSPEVIASKQKKKVTFRSNLEEYEVGESSGAGGEFSEDQIEERGGVTTTSNESDIRATDIEADTDSDEESTRMSIETEIGT